MGDIAKSLLQKKLMNETQMKTALKYQKEIGGGNLGDICVKLGFIKEKDLTNLKAEQQTMDVAEEKDLRPHMESLRMIPRRIVEQHRVIPIKKEGDTITLAMYDTMDLDAQEEIQFATGCKVETVLAPKSAILKALRLYFDATAVAEGGEDTSSQASRASTTTPTPKSESVSARKEAYSEASKQRDHSDGEIHSSGGSPLHPSHASVFSALVNLLIEKKIIVKDELYARAQEIEKRKGK